MADTNSLTAAERARFAAWLERDMVQTEILIEQAKLADMPATTIGRLKAEVAAARTVLRRLRRRRRLRRPRRRAAGDVS